MTIEEARNLLNSSLPKEGRQNAFTIQLMSAMEIAIKALEKQIPKKVEETYKAECIEDIEAYGENALFGYCPMCGELQCSVWNENTCGNCGLKLDWSEEE